MDVPVAVTLKDAEDGAVTVWFEIVYVDEIGVQDEFTVNVAQLV